MMQSIVVYEEWKHKLHELGPEIFEELCFDLVQSMGFMNVDWKTGGSDKGRDIEAKLRTPMPDGFTEIVEKWHFECKLSNRGISAEKVSSKIDWANAERVDKLAILSNAHLTNQAKEFISLRSKSTHCKIVNWTGKRFLNVLFGNSKVCKSYFPDEQIPPQFLKEVEQTEMLPFIEDRFMRMGFRRNMDFLKVTREIAISSEDPGFVQFVEENVLVLEGLPDQVKIVVLELLAAVSFKQGDIDKAIDFLDSLLQIMPRNEVAIINKGIALEDLGRINDAMDSYESVIKLNSRNAAALNNIGHILVRKGFGKRALRMFDRALEVAPEMDIAVANRCKVLSRMKRRVEAESFVDSELEKRPESAILWNARAEIYLNRMHYKKAVSAANKALRLNPNFVEALNNKGVILEHNGKYQLQEKYYEMALEVFNEVAAKAPNFALGWTNIFVCQLNLKRTDELSTKGRKGIPVMQ
jgi:Tfp pilus assembly protein PilF